jgi:hypothetical protein
MAQKIASLNGLPRLYNPSKSHENFFYPKELPPRRGNRHRPPLSGVIRSTRETLKKAGEAHGLPFQ